MSSPVTPAFRLRGRAIRVGRTVADTGRGALRRPPGPPYVPQFAIRHDTEARSSRGPTPRDDHRRRRRRALDPDLCTSGPLARSVGSSVAAPSLSLGPPASRRGSASATGRAWPGPVEVGAPPTGAPRSGAEPRGRHGGRARGPSVLGPKVKESEGGRRDRAADRSGGGGAGAGGDSGDDVKFRV